MDEQIKEIYTIMLTEKILQVFCDFPNDTNDPDSVGITIVFENYFGAKRHYLATLSPKKAQQFHGTIFYPNMCQYNRIKPRNI